MLIILTFGLLLPTSELGEYWQRKYNAMPCMEKLKKLLEL